MQVLGATNKRYAGSDDDADYAHHPPPLPHLILDGTVSSLFVMTFTFFDMTLEQTFGSAFAFASCVSEPSIADIPTLYQVFMSYSFLSLGALPFLPSRGFRRPPLPMCLTLRITQRL